MTFYCEVCDKTMHESDERSHVSGKKHRSKLGLRSVRGGSDNNSVSNYKTNKIKPFKPKLKKTSGNKVSIKINDKINNIKYIKLESKFESKYDISNFPECLKYHVFTCLENGNEETPAHLSVLLDINRGLFIKTFSNYEVYDNETFIDIVHALYNIYMDLSIEMINVYNQDVTNILLKVVRYLIGSDGNNNNAVNNSINKIPKLPTNYMLMVMSDIIKRKIINIEQLNNKLEDIYGYMEFNGYVDNRELLCAENKIQENYDKICQNCL